jgi:F-type H+-transporting ATPase subunit a
MKPMITTASPIDLGAARTATIAGLTINVDTVLATVIAGVIVIAVGLYAQRKASAHRPSRIQLAWEAVVSAAERHVGQNVAPAARGGIPLAVALFVFILVSSLLETVPSGHPHKLLPPPTGDLNLTAALALLVVVWVHATAIRVRGLRGYFRHYLRPHPWLLPLKILEELVKPITLALRLFGNVFAGAVMVILIFEVIPPILAPLPLAAWKLFSVFIAVMQAFLFPLLAVLYLQGALEPDADTPAAEEEPADPGSATRAGELL